ncbi:hypothetical protein ACLSYZ_11180 [Avibacterium avium]|uniref:hypothetical protein n=1 Tax=Avibacterium TaxID=292486 RepID=UPI0039FC4D03
MNKILNSIFALFILVISMYFFNFFLIKKEKEMFPDFFILKKGGESHTKIVGSDEPISIPFLHYCRKISTKIDDKFKQDWVLDNKKIISKIEKWADFSKYNGENTDFIFTKEFNPNRTFFFGSNDVWTLYKLNISKMEVLLIYCNFNDVKQIPDEWL